jgi:hypothetical protein
MEWFFDCLTLSFVRGPPITIIPQKYIDENGYNQWLNGGKPEGKHLEHMNVARKHFKEKYGGDILVVPDEVFETLSRKKYYQGAAKLDR